VLSDAVDAPPDNKAVVGRTELQLERVGGMNCTQALPAAGASDSRWESCTLCGPIWPSGSRRMESRSLDPFIVPPDRSGKPSDGAVVSAMADALRQLAESIALSAS
jgi:hypothetical protein